MTSSSQLPVEAPETPLPPEPRAAFGDAEISDFPLVSCSSVPCLTAGGQFAGGGVIGPGGNGSGGKGHGSGDGAIAAKGSPLDGDAAGTVADPLEPLLARSTPALIVVFPVGVGIGNVTAPVPLRSDRRRFRRCRCCRLRISCN